MNKNLSPLSVRRNCSPGHTRLFSQPSRKGLDMQVIKTQDRTPGGESLFSQTRILLVDENPLDLDRYCRMLHKLGFPVQACADFEEAARLLEGANFDCIVASQGGPGFEGRRILEQSVARDRLRPVVIICRHHSVTCYLEAMQLGAVDYIEKPLTTLEIVRVVTTHLQPHHTAA